MERSWDIVRVVARRAGVALLVGAVAAAGVVGIRHAVIGAATASTGTRSAPASVAAPERKLPEADRPSGPPAGSPASDSAFPWYTFFEAFTNVPNNQERVVYCGRNFPFVVSGYGLVIPTLAGYQVSSHAVYNPDGWAFSAHAFVGRTVSFNVFAICTSQPRG
jgi:hypothetical protein